jgi:Rho termination factor, N-terminal domain
MAASSRPQPQRNDHPLRRRIVDTIRATLSRMRPIDRRGGTAPGQADGVGKGTPARLGNLRERSVASIRHLVGQSVGTTRSLPARARRQLSRLARRGRGMAGAIRTMPGTGAPAERARTARNRTEVAGASVGREAGERGPEATKRTARTERRQIQDKPAKARGGTRQTKERHAKPRQAKRRQDLEQQTVQELRKQAREAGVQGRSSMTKDELIKALREHR